MPFLEFTRLEKGLWPVGKGRPVLIKTESVSAVLLSRDFPNGVLIWVDGGRRGVVVRGTYEEVKARVLGAATKKPRARKKRAPTPPRRARRTKSLGS